MIELPTQVELHRLLDYNPETGVFRWKPRGVGNWDKRWAGREAFPCTYNGYRVGSLLGRRSVAAHRVAFKYVYGYDAPGEIDHINGNRADNRIINLRSATITQQRRNAAMPSTNKSGVVGVRYKKDKRKWTAYISLADRYHHIGYFDDFADAVTARKAAEKKHGFHENHGRRA